MTLTDLHNALKFLNKVYVGRMDEECLVKTIQAIEKEVERKDLGLSTTA
jgi:hypothetical protein